MSLPEGNETFDEDTSLGTFLGLSSEHVVKKMESNVIYIFDLE